MSAMAPQITSLPIVYSTLYSGTDQRKHQSSASLDFVRGMHQWSVNSPHKGPVTRKMHPFDDVIMFFCTLFQYHFEQCHVILSSISLHYRKWFVTINYGQNNKTTAHWCLDLWNHRQLDYSINSFWPFVKRIYRWPVGSLHKWLTMWKVNPCHDAIMKKEISELKCPQRQRISPQSCMAEFDKIFSKH